MVCACPHAGWFSGQGDGSCARGRFAGFSPAFVTVMVLGISGAAAGVAGMVEVSANIGQLQPTSPLAMDLLRSL